jgi:hypothetical protein
MSSRWKNKRLPTLFPLPTEILEREVKESICQGPPREKGCGGKSV